MIFKLLLLCAAACSFSAAAEAPVPAELVEPGAIGRHTAYLKESSRRLTLDEAIAAHAAGQFRAGEGEILNFGIGSAPVWIRFSVANGSSLPLLRRLSIETSWLDSVEVRIRHSNVTVAEFKAGDRLPFERRPIKNRFFVFDHAYAAGTSDVYIRVETPDPMVVPLRFLTVADVQVREQQQGYSYGFLYGFLLALAAYNVALFASLRNTRYLLYSVYLGMFILMNISYTGHGFEWLWPDSPRWQQWGNPILMLLYGISGLFFALRFLDARRNFPRVARVILGGCAAFAAAIFTAALAGNATLALLAAFCFVFFFSGGMLTLGVLGIRAGQEPARYFLLASIAAIVGAVSTGLATWGFIPHNAWTFRAVEGGMIVDATLLALALAQQFRVVQEKRIRAEHLAQIDPLTGINNRRAFHERTQPAWSGALRHHRPVSVILLDIDRFKLINDAQGHAQGDRVLVAIAGILTHAVRQEDVVARWGGEEFIVFLPETESIEAVALAERLRAAIADIRLDCAGGGTTTATASLGVATRAAEHGTLDSLISAADRCLYRAKNAGRNRVSHGAQSEAGPVSAS